MFQLLIGTRFPFMKYRRFAYTISLLLVGATTAMLFTKGPRYGVDFEGGTLLQLRTAKAVPADEMRSALGAAGLVGVELQKLTGEGVDNEYVLRFHGGEGDPFPKVQQALESRFPGTNAELRRIETVGPKVGSDLRGKAIKAMFWSLLAILVYVGIRYRMMFAVGGILALFHDVFVTLGMLMFTGREITLTVLAALLTIAGYSINDTIVVFDRIRERDKSLAKEPHEKVMDIAVNETLSRTMITAFTVFLTSLALFIWGGEVLRDFSFAMLVGVSFGTFSSVYVASALALDIWLWSERRKATKPRA